MPKFSQIVELFKTLKKSHKKGGFLIGLFAEGILNWKNFKKWQNNPYILKNTFVLPKFTRDLMSFKIIVKANI